ncbi:MAG: transglycosylase SLT domain-containing protein [Kangiellaceae bacterium]
MSNVIKNTKHHKATFLVYLLICISTLVYSSADLAAEKTKNSTQQAKPNSDFRAQLIATIKKANESFIDHFDAKVWLFEQAKRLEKVAPHIPENERWEILRLVHQESQKFDLDPMLVLALINVESDFDQYAISSAGALGLMQVMPFWKNEIGHPNDNLNEIQTNIQYGCAILSLYLKKEKYDTTMALGRYNGSRGQYWYPARVYKAMRKVWHP